MNQIIQEWIDKAEGDFSTAEREFAVTCSPNYDAVCFHAQQCIEKLLKALMIKFKATPPRIHDLAELGRLVAPFCPSWQPKIEDLNYLTRAAVDFRYPGEAADKEEAGGAVSIARKLRMDLLELLKML